MYAIGKMNRLTVNRETSSGFYLKNEDSFGDVFLPPSMAPEGIAIGDELDVFIYVDTKDQLIATSEVPLALLDEYAVLNVVEVQEFGAFLHWGIQKDLLIPGNEQKIKLNQGESALVRICIEEGTDRLFATTKFGRFLEEMDFDINTGDEVSLIPVEETELGYRVVINKKYLGLIYHTEIFSNIKMNQEITGFVKKIREDGFVDAALQIQGIKNLDNSKRTILAHLFKQAGHSTLHDKSSPDEIRSVLGMSKKTFKSSLGMLYKDGMVKIKKDGIELIHKNKMPKNRK